MFKQVLEGLISRLEEVQGAAMIGVDGIPIAEFPVRAGIDLERIAAECTSLIKTAVATVRALDQDVGLRHARRIRRSPRLTVWPFRS